MLVGPAFGAVAVIITAFTVSLPVIGFTRLLEGASTAASVPSILGFIAFATAADELLRGRAVARFEAATLAGLMVGFVVAGPLFQLFGPQAFLLNALVYGVSFAIYKFGVPKHAEPEPAARSHDPEEGLRRYVRILRGSHVWLLAPTWIAINATLGLYTSQTLFQLVRDAEPPVREPAADGRLRPAAGLARASRSAACCSSRASSTGAAGSRRCAGRRSSCTGSSAGAVMLAAAVGINHAAGWPLPVMLALDRRRCAAGLFVLAGATPAAIGLLADMTEAYPDDRGAIMGLYSVFLGLGQIFGSLVGGEAAQRAGLDGIFLASFVMLGIALLPLGGLRRYEHRVGAGPARIDGREAAGAADG